MLEERGAAKLVASYGEFYLMATRKPAKSKPKKSVSFLEPTTRTKQDRQRRVLDAISLKRRHPELSMSEVARRSGTTVKTIRRYAPDVLQTRSGRLDVRATDKIRRDIQFLSETGRINVRVTSRDASRIALYSNAVRKYVIYGDDSGLRRFVGKTFKSEGQTHTFVTEIVTLRKLQRAGEISFIDIYAPGTLDS